MKRKLWYVMPLLLMGVVAWASTTEQGSVFKKNVIAALAGTEAKTVGGDLAVTGNLTVTGTTNSYSELRTMSVNYYDENCAASQSAAVLYLNPSSTVTSITTPYAGSIIGISVSSNATCTSGTFTADVTIDGTVTGLQATLDSVTNTTTNTLTQANDTDTFAAGQRIGCKVTTNSAWAPNTADVVVTVFVEY